MDLISESANKPQKTANKNAELLQNLLVGIENMGENFKQLRTDMEYWKTPAYQEAEREYGQMNQELLQEVSFSVPAVTEPENAAVSPNTSVPLVFAPQFLVPQSVNVPQTGEGSMDMGLRSEWVTGQALKKPYPGALFRQVIRVQWDLMLVQGIKILKPKFRSFSILLDRMLVRQILYMM